MWLAAAQRRVYMLAQASIAGTIIVRMRGFTMKPYYTTKNYAMRNSVGYLMRISSNRLLPQMEAMFEDQELTFSQWTTLVALHDGRVTTAGDLAYNICHDAGSLTRLIDQMVKRGLVTRGRSESDRRVVTLALTPPGRKLVEALAPKVMDFWNGMLSGFSHAEIDTLIALLTRLVVATEAKTGRKLMISHDPIISRKTAVTKSKRKAS
jgi:DNA-binding MarR family transcriptional regulator